MNKDENQWILGSIWHRNRLLKRRLCCCSARSARSIPLPIPLLGHSILLMSDIISWSFFLGWLLVTFNFASFSYLPRSSWKLILAFYSSACQGLTSISIVSLLFFLSILMDILRRRIFGQFPLLNGINWLSLQLERFLLPPMSSKILITSKSSRISSICNSWTMTLSSLEGSTSLSLAFKPWVLSESADASGFETYLPSRPTESSWSIYWASF